MRAPYLFLLLSLYFAFAPLRAHAQILSDNQIQNEPARSIRIERYFDHSTQQKKNRFMYRAARVTEKGVTWLERPLGDSAGYLDIQMEYIDGHVAEGLREIKSAGVWVAVSAGSAGALMANLDSTQSLREEAIRLRDAYLKMLDSKWLEYVGQESGSFSVHRYHAIFDFAEADRELLLKIKEIRKAEQAVLASKKGKTWTSPSKINKWGTGLVFASVTSIVGGMIYNDDVEEEILKKPELITALDFVSRKIFTATMSEVEVIRLKKTLEAVLWCID